MTDLHQSVVEQGYFELPGALPPELVARARRDVEARADSLDSFEDDAMWEILDAILPVAREALAHDVAILPSFWAWRIEPGRKGWHAHRDDAPRARDQNGNLTMLTIWVPLTDATPRNGCIHCVPAYFDLAYENPHANNVVFDNQYIRAVPATAGSILGWSHALLHWGGVCAPGEPARIATSYEVIRSDLPDLMPRWHPAGWRPGRSERRELIAEMREKYAHLATP